VISVDAASFFAVIAVAAIAAVLVVVIPRPYAPPVVVLELILGILIGPPVLGLAESDDFIDFLRREPLESLGRSCWSPCSSRPRTRSRKP
jgi:xanthosine utilization system XapX-like protein